jgi:hypothetical protein
MYVYIYVHVQLRGDIIYLRSQEIPHVLWNPKVTFLLT